MRRQVVRGVTEQAAPRVPVYGPVLLAVCLAGALPLVGRSTVAAAAPSAVTTAALERPLAFTAGDTAAVEAALRLAERHMRAGHPDSVLLAVGPLLAAALAQGNERLELRTRLHEAGALALGGRLREAEGSALRAGELAARHDAPAAGRMARRWLGYSLLGQGRTAEASAAYEMLRDEARAAGDRREEAYALLGLAYQSLNRGDSAQALADYERSAGLFRAAGEVAIALDAEVGLARALGAEGRYGDMRRLYERILRDGEKAGQFRVVGYALNNLGSYEYQAGDPGRAVEYWERALVAKRGHSDPAALITPTVNLALAHMALGAFDDARTGLESMLAHCRQGGYREQEAQVLKQLATFEQAHGRHAEARNLWRQVLGIGEAAGQDGLESALEIVASLAREGQGARALQLADSVAARLPGGAEDYLSSRYELVRAQALVGAGLPAEALGAAERARALFRARGFRSDELAALVLAAGCERQLAAAEPARADSALARLREARRLWEDVRAVPRDPQWRERRGAIGTSIHMDLAFLLLRRRAVPGARPAADEAFDALQSYKARTLLERRLGPDAFAAAATGEPAVTLERLQGGILKPGEVLLDYYLGLDGSLLFAVTDSTCEAFELPPAAELRDRVALFLELVASPTGRADAQPPYGAAARRLAGDLLAPGRPALEGARSLLVAADGLLNRVPFEILPAPGRDAPLGSVFDVARVPSAGVLAQLRAGKPGGAAGRGVALLRGEESANTAVLPGADSEARRLERAYRGVHRLVAAPDSAGHWLRGAAGAAVLHIPAHSEAFDQRPWNSRIRVGTDVDGHPRWLASAAIAEEPLAVPLAVLSGCSSAGGHALSGEGMLGLSGAFLAAGSQAVVASLWDVDDGATAQLMEAFYKELSRGRTVAAALATARAMLAAETGTTAPRYWAAFVVIGDGALTVPLAARRAAVPPAVVAALAALGLGGVVAVAAARRRRISKAAVPSVIPRPGRTLP